MLAPSLRHSTISQLLSSYFPDYLDRSLRIPSYWAHCESIVAGDLAAARKVWEDVTLKSGLGRCEGTGLQEQNGVMVCSREYLLGYYPDPSWH